MIIVIWKEFRWKVYRMISGGNEPGLTAMVKKIYGGLRKAEARKINHSEHRATQRIYSVPAVVKKIYGGLRKIEAKDINHSGLRIQDGNQYSSLKLQKLQPEMRGNLN